MTVTESRSPVLLIVGPTASGKSDLALALALRFAGEIVGADSMQVYRDLDIGTAKPPPAARSLVPHHLIDVASPEQDFSMGEFVRRAERAIEEIAARGRLPIIVGGTGLYVRALLRGMVEAPGRDERLRARLRAISVRRGGAFLHRMLARVDSEASRRIGVNDPQRIVRALEVYLLTRRPLSAWFREEGFGKERYPAVKIGIELPREELHRRIDQRVDRFVSEGLFDEVRRLLAAGIPLEANAFKALGYREAVAAIGGAGGEAETVDRIRKNTRRYAKRQLTWFRREEGVFWLDGRLSPEALAAEAERIALPALRKLGWRPPA